MSMVAVFEERAGLKSLRVLGPEQIKLGKRSWKQLER